MLGLPSLDPQDVHAAFSSMLLASHRAVFLRATRVEPAYAKAAADGLSADVRHLPADAGAAAKAVNDWADADTHHRIDHLFDVVPAGAAMVLGDAAFLKFSRARRFDPARTQDEPFHRHPGAGASTGAKST